MPSLDCLKVLNKPNRGPTKFVEPPNVKYHRVGIENPQGVLIGYEIPLTTNLRGCNGSYILNGVVPPLLSMY
jgi:hypothetical protein